MYVELVQGKISNRPGKCIPKSEINKYRNSSQGRPIYRSTYVYKQEFNGSVSNYMKDKTIDNILIDIDYTGNSNFIEIVRATAMELEEYINENNYLVAFSGTGFHIIFSAHHFEFEPSQYIHKTVKSTMDNMFDGIDLSIFNKASIYRILNTKNPKSGRYKIPLYKRELLHKSYDEIKEMATEPRWDFDTTKVNLEKKIDLTEYKVDPGKMSLQEVFEPTRIASCISNILNSTPKKGSRHPTALRVASHFRRSGIPSDVTERTIKHWLRNEPDKTEEEINRIVSETYNKGYKYGCKDTILVQYCSPQCVYYKKKNYKQAVHTITDMHRKAKDKIQTDFSNVTLNLDEIFNLPKETRVYPGEFVVLVGLTGAGKTALAQQVVAGLDIFGNRIKNVLPTLYLSMEMSNSIMYRRWWQQIKGIDKEKALQQIKEADGELTELSHIMMRYISPNLDDLKSEINQHQPKLVVVDHLELLQSDGNSARERVSNISKELRKIALEHDIIVLAISQIGRKDSRENNLDLFSAKESSNIEHDCRKHIGIWGVQGENAKKLEFFKNTDGEYLPEQYLMMNNSFRFSYDDNETWKQIQREMKKQKAMEKF